MRTAETWQDTRSAILNVLSESRLGSMPSNELRAAVLREIGCSEAATNARMLSLYGMATLPKYQLCQKDGARGWFTRLAYRGENMIQ